MSNFDAPGSNPYSYTAINTPGGADPSGYEAARRKVKFVALAMLVMSPLSIAFSGFDLAYRVMYYDQKIDLLDEGNEAQQRGAEVGKIAGIVVQGLCLVCQVFCIYAAILMLQMKHREIAMTALGIYCVPCLTACCVLGIPIGIWGLVVVLSDQQVAAAFRNA